MNIIIKYLYNKYTYYYLLLLYSPYVMSFPIEEIKLSWEVT